MPRAAQSAPALRARNARAWALSHLDRGPPASPYSRAEKWQWARCEWALRAVAPPLQTPDAATGAPTSPRLKGRADPETRARSQPRGAQAPLLPRQPPRF